MTAKSQKKSPNDRLEEIAAEIRAGKDPEKFQKELDRLLGTEMEPRDVDEEARWEEDYRNQGDVA